VRSEFDTRQPTMRRANTSITNATYTKPRQVATYVRSATQSWLEWAVKSLAMVERYSQLSPRHLRAAVAKLVPAAASAHQTIAVLTGQPNLNTLPQIAVGAVEVGRNWDSAPTDLTPASEDAC